jgi:hypothetical protein
VCCDQAQPIVVIPLFPPPVVLIHGVWANAGSWLRLDMFLANSFYLTPAIVRADYGPFSHRSFADEQVQLALDHAVNSALTRTRNSGVAADKVDYWHGRACRR